MNKETETVILESLRMLLWENHRKWESINLKHGGGGCVETKEIEELIERINDILNPKKEENSVIKGTNDAFSESKQCEDCMVLHSPQNCPKFALSENQESKKCSTCKDTLGSNSLCVECISCNPQKSSEVKK